MATPTPSPSVPPASPSSPMEPTVKKHVTLYIGIAAGLVVLSGIGTFAAYRMTSKNVSTPTPQPTVTTSTSTSAAAPQSPFELRKRKNVTEADYERAFIEAASNTQLLADRFTNANSIFVRLNGQRISVRIPGTIPNLVTLRDDTTVINMLHARNASGENILDVNSAFETDAFFTGVSLEELSEPAYHFLGERRLHLIKDAQEEDIVDADGELVLTLPVGLQTFSFTSADIDKQKNGNGKLTLTYWNVTSTPETVEEDPATVTDVTVYYEGFQEKFVGIKGYNDRGNELPIISENPARREGMDARNYSARFLGELARLDVFETDHSMIKKIPFAVKNLRAAEQPSAPQANTEPTTPVATPTPEAKPVVSAADAAVRKAVIDAIINRQNVIASHDIARIRQYMHDAIVAAGTEEDLAELEKMSDTELLSTAKMLESFAFQGDEKTVRAYLDSPKTTWAWTGDNKVLLSYSPEKGTSVRTTMRKGTNGKWY